MFSKENIFSMKVETPRYHLRIERDKMVIDVGVQKICYNIYESNSKCIERLHK